MTMATTLLPRFVDTIGLAAAATFPPAPAQRPVTPNLPVKISPWTDFNVIAGIGNAGALALSRVSHRPTEHALAPLRRQFFELRRLTHGWDGANSAPLAEAALSVAARVLETALLRHPDAPHPTLVPVADGGLQAEWFLPRSQVEMYFEADGEVSIWMADRPAGNEREESGEDAARLLAAWLTSGCLTAGKTTKTA